MRAFDCLGGDYHSAAPANTGHIAHDSRAGSRNEREASVTDNEDGRLTKPANVTKVRTENVTARATTMSRRFIGGSFEALAGKDAAV